MNEAWKTSAAQDFKVADKPARAVGAEFLLYETETSQTSAGQRGERDAA
jgi:hypothetical protein